MSNETDPSEVKCEVSSEGELTGKPETVGSLDVVDDRSDERGYVIAMTALLLIPMLIFAAFAVDVGGWYSQAARTQRAADAAALAAVVWMPDKAAATQAALDVAAKNGFIHKPLPESPGNATVTVEKVGSQQVQVRIMSEGDVYFGKPVLDSISIERFAVAEYVLAVPMGNPTSALGTGNLPGGDGIWLAVNGVCQSRQQGDPFSVKAYDTSPNQLNSCTNPSGYTGEVNQRYEQDGYVYIVDYPSADAAPGGIGDVTVQMYQPGLCSGGTFDNYGNNGPRIDIRLYQNDDTPLSDQDNLDRAPYSHVTFGRTECTGWYDAVTIPGGASSGGRWFLRVRGVNPHISDAHLTGQSSDRVAGLNSYSLRLKRGVDSSTCSSLVSVTCPEIFAKDWLSVYRPAFSSSGPAVFYLAEIDQVHAGKTVEIQLFDAGEGMDNVQFLGPDDSPLDFEWEHYDCEFFGTNCGGGGLNPSDNNCGGPPCLKTNVAGVDRFQGRIGRVLIDLPGNYDCNGQTDCWWKIRYEPSGGVPTDRTTWSVRVIGDPVRLIE